MFHSIEWLYVKSHEFIKNYKEFLNLNLFWNKANVFIFSKNSIWKINVYIIYKIKKKNKSNKTFSLIIIIVVIC